jgi:hypothetical protein
MRSTSTKSKIAADEPARQPPGAVTQSAIAHAENATRTRVAFFLVGSSVPTKSSQPRRSKSTGEFCEVPRDVQMSDETLWPIRRKRSLGCAHHFRPTYPDFLHGAPPTPACAAFIKESRMKCANASKLDRKSGVRSGERGAPVDSLRICYDTDSLAPAFRADFMVAGPKALTISAGGGTTEVVP